MHLYNVYAFIYIYIICTIYVCVIFVVFGVGCGLCTYTVLVYGI